MRSEDYDRHIRADEVTAGDELHLTVMGGDEYVTVNAVEESEPGKVRFVFAPWMGPPTAAASSDQRVRVRK